MLFGEFKYDERNGYLTIQKTDERKVWLLDLGDFPQNTWSTVPPNNDSGGFKVFFKGEPDFGREVSSVKWGE